MLSNRNQNTISQLKQFLNTHKEVMIQHIRMLNEIKKGKVSEEEFYDYIEDVVGITKKLSPSEKEKVINDLLSSAQYACKSAISLSLLLKNEMNEFEISSFYITLKYLCESAGRHDSEFKGKGTPWDYKARYAFNFRDVSKYCLKKLENHLSDSFEKLDKICNIKTVILNPKTNNKKVFEYEFRTDIFFEVEKLTYLYKSNRTPLHEHVFELRVRRIKSENHLAVEAIDKLRLSIELNYIIFDLLDRKNQQFNKIGVDGYNNQPNNESVEEMINFIYTSSLNVCEMINILDGLKLNLDSIADALDEEKNVEEFINSNQAKICKQLNKIASEIDSVLNRLNEQFNHGYSKSEMEEIGNFIKLIEGAKESIKQESKKWNTKLSFGSLSDARVSKQLKDMLISGAANDIENTIDYLDTLESIKLEKIAEKESEMLLPKRKYLSRNSSSSSSSEEANLFKAKKAEETKLYKEKNAEIKAQKQQEKINLTVSVTSVGIFSEPKIELAPNELLQPVLSNLKPDHIEILRGILNKNTSLKISYHDVYFLIVNHLGGSIEEIGNGSSHKRIRIGKFYSELSSTRSPVSDEEVTGGLFRPHGKSHNKELLSHFNLELVANTLLKAGITLEKLAELESKKSLTV